MTRSLKIVWLLFTAFSGPIFACNFDIEAKYLGNQSEAILFANTKAGDHYLVRCGHSAEVKGVVSVNGILVMSNRAEMSVKNVARADVLTRLENMQSMLHSPNGLQIQPKVQKNR